MRSWDKIMDLPSSPNFTEVRKLFSHIPGEVSQKLPENEVDLLIWCIHMDLHPSGGEGRMLTVSFESWTATVPARPYAAGVTAVTACKMDFWEAGGWGVQSDSFIIRRMEEQEELNTLKKGMKHDPVKKVINVSYPVKSDPSTLNLSPKPKRILGVGSVVRRLISPKHFGPMSLRTNTPSYQWEL